MQRGLSSAVRNTGGMKKVKIQRPSFIEEFVQPEEGEADGAIRFAELLVKHYPDLGEALPLLGASSESGKEAPVIRIGWSAAQTLQLMQSWLRLVRKTLRHQGILCNFDIIHARSDLEAKWELISTEWLVQNGDLTVKGVVSSSSAGQQFALIELQQAFFSMKRNTSLGGMKDSMDLASFVQQFRDLRIPFVQVEEVYESARTVG